jgi:hypothetical protein
MERVPIRRPFALAGRKLLDRQDVFERSRHMLRQPPRPPRRMQGRPIGLSGVGIPYQCGPSGANVSKTANAALELEGNRALALDERSIEFSAVFRNRPLAVRHQQQVASTLPPQHGALLTPLCMDQVNSDV